MKNSFRWAFKIFILSICLSIVFSMISQSLFPKLSSILSLFVIMFFITLSVVFDMINVAVTTIKKEDLASEKGKNGYSTALKLCNNREKVASFCGDVVGDICGILSGAGGVSLVVNMNINNLSIYFIVTCIISAFIAGITIFGKAIMKTYSVENCKTVIMKVGGVLEGSVFGLFKKKNKEKDEKTSKNS